MTKTKKRKGRGYTLGRAREFNLLYKLWKHGFVAFRCPFSAGGAPSAKVKPIDIIAIRKSGVAFIQVSKRLRDVTEAEREELMRLSELCGAEPVIAYIESGNWSFETPLHPVKSLSLEEL